MVKWELEDKYNLSKAILENTNPTAIPWEKVAATMGSKFGPQACRGQFNAIKKGFSTSEPTEAGPSTQPSSGTANISTKAKKPATTSTTASATKGRKRKASDDLNTDTAPKASKVKKGGDKAVMEAAEGVNAEQDEHGQGGQDGAHQRVYPEHQNFIIAQGLAPYKSPYANA